MIHILDWLLCRPHKRQVLLDMLVHQILYLDTTELWRDIFLVVHLVAAVRTLPKKWLLHPKPRLRTVCERGAWVDGRTLLDLALPLFGNVAHDSLGLALILAVDLQPGRPRVDLRPTSRSVCEPGTYRPDASVVYKIRIGKLTCHLLPFLLIYSKKIW